MEAEQLHIKGLRKRGNPNRLTPEQRVQKKRRRADKEKLRRERIKERFQTTEAGLVLAVALLGRPVKGRGMSDAWWKSRDALLSWIDSQRIMRG